MNPSKIEPGKWVKLTQTAHTPRGTVKKGTRLQVKTRPVRSSTGYWFYTYGEYQLNTDWVKPS